MRNSDQSGANLTTRMDMRLMENFRDGSRAVTEGDDKAYKEHLALSSDGFAVNYLNEALDLQELSSESSGASVLANLNEAVDQLRSQSVSINGVWKPFYVPVMFRDLVIGGGNATKQMASPIHYKPAA